MHIQPQEDQHGYLLVEHRDHSRIHLRIRVQDVNQGVPHLDAQDLARHLYRLKDD